MTINPLNYSPNFTWLVPTRMTSSVVVLSISLLSIGFSSLIGSIFCRLEDESTRSSVRNTSLSKTSWQGAPSPKKPLASLTDNLPRSGDMDSRSGVLASSEEDTIAFGFLENLLNSMRRDGQKSEKSMQVAKSSDHTFLPSSLGSCLLWLLSASLPYRGPWPLHSPILWTDFGVLFQEVVERGLECKLLVPPFIHLPFVGFRTSQLDHPRSPFLMWGGLTGPGGGLTVSGGGLTGSRSGLTVMLCHLWGFTVVL
jgi:hypothetical protein